MPPLRFIYRAWRYRLRLDTAEIARIRAHLRPGTTAFDIGAHKGGYAYWLARDVGPGGRVVCFEPQAALAHALARNAGRMGWKHMRVENLALSDHAGQAHLEVPGDGTPSPGARLSESAPAATTGAASVRLQTLDGYLESFDGPAPSFIKCDVEGHELSVFRGGEGLLRAHHPALFFECERRHLRTHGVGDVFAYLAGLGYTGHFFRAGELRPVEAFDPARDQADPGADTYVNNFWFERADG
jgi:FkbM family methyltransferase